STAAATHGAEVGGGMKCVVRTTSDDPASHTSLGRAVRELSGPYRRVGSRHARSERFGAQPAKRRGRVPIPRTSRYHATNRVSGSAGGSARSTARAYCPTPVRRGSTADLASTTTRTGEG